MLSLFWNVATVPDLMGEPVRAWGDPTSRTRAHMRRYVRDVVERYRGSSSVWGWELGNEWSLAVRRPGEPEHRPDVAPDLGTPAERTAADDLTVDDVRSAFAAFRREVRRHDRTRIISSGNSIPRDNVWHDGIEGDVVSIHTYGADIAHIPEAASFPGIAQHCPHRISRSKLVPRSLTQSEPEPLNSRQARRRSFAAPVHRLCATAL